MALDILDGHQVSDRLMRLSKPISLLLPYLLTKIGLSGITAFMIQSILSVCICIYFIKGILQAYFDASSDASTDKSTPYFLSICILLGCQCTAVYGLAVLTDSLSWAIILGLIYYIQQNKTPEIKQLFCIGLGVGIGFFVKESCLLILVFYTFHLFLRKLSAIQVLRKLGLVYSITLFVIACISLFQDIYLGLSLIHI